MTEYNGAQTIPTTRPGTLLSNKLPPHIPSVYKPIAAKMFKAPTSLVRLEPAFCL